MKFSVLFPAMLFLYTSAVAQNVGIGTQTPQGKLHVKGSEDVSQFIIEPNSTQSNTKPILKFMYGNSELLRLHTDNESNVFLGELAGQLNQTSSFSFSPDGKYNTFIGSGVGRFNTTGYDNTGLGYSALISNSTGTYNTALGSSALISTSTGKHNTATGSRALLSNSTGNYNTAVGYNALVNTRTSEFNTAVGSRAGQGFDNGYNNVFVGANTDVNAAGLFNVIAIGQATVVGASSTARFGNPATTSYGGWAGWSSISDGRFKRDVQENVPGLSFITKLRPVTYHLQAGALDVFLKSALQKGAGEASIAIHQKALLDKEKIIYSGFIAQEVEAAAKSLGFDFSGVDAPKNANDTYALRYAEFVVPLVKAVQEQQVQIEALKKENAALKHLQQNQEGMKKELEQLKAQQKDFNLLKQQVTELLMTKQ